MNPGLILTPTLALTVTRMQGLDAKFLASIASIGQAKNGDGDLMELGDMTAGPLRRRRPWGDIPEQIKRTTEGFGGNFAFDGLKNRRRRTGSDWDAVGLTNSRIWWY